MSLRRRGNIEKGLRDYMVPIVGWILLLLLIFSMFSWWDDTPKVDTENKTWLEISLNWLNSDATIVYPWDFKKKIEGDISLYKWEKVIVKEWNVSLTMAWLWDFKLGKLWELKYMENWDFTLYSSDLWLNSTSAVNIDMRFAKVKVGENSHISFSQNEMSSTIYLISWFAEVTNLVWVNTVLWPWQKVTISRLEASNESIDLWLKKENLDDFYKQSDWFILNNWNSYLTSETTETWTWETDTSSWSTQKSALKNASDLITFSNLFDESNVSSDTISISGNYFDEDITKIEVNGKTATINSDLKTFKFENIPVPNKENNLVFKVYDDTDEVISKFVYTIYYEWWNTNTTSNTISNTGKDWGFSVKTFEIDWSKFTFTQPTIKDTYTTTEDFITIRWKVDATWISKVTVNDFVLSSFNWSTWRYHASTDNNNLSNWTNIYEVKYFDNNGNLVYKNYYTIIKQPTSTTQKQETNTITEEEIKPN